MRELTSLKPVLVAIGPLGIEDQTALHFHVLKIPSNSFLNQIYELKLLEKARFKNSSGLNKKNVCKGIIGSLKILKIGSGSIRAKDISQFF